MVSTDEQGGTYDGGFQYSLCRVVLMVKLTDLGSVSAAILSVLALSSRFDGRTCCTDTPAPSVSFSTRSVESF